MKTFIRILCFVGLLLLNTTIQAQQITQQISYSLNDVEVQEADGYDVINLVDATFFEKEESIGNPPIVRKI